MKEASKKTAFGRLFGHWETFLVIIFLAVNLFFIIQTPFYLNQNNLMNSMINFMDKGLMVYGIMMVLILGEIDISIASIITLSGCVAGWACEQGCPLALCIIIALAVGALCGAFNGLLLVKFKELNSTIVTLGSQILFRGLAYMLLGDESLKTYAKQLSGLAWDKIFGLPVILVAFIVLSVIFYYVIHRTCFGRRLYAIGTNKTASYFSGIYTDRIKLLVFTISGLCAAFAGLFLAAKLASVRASIATGFEMEVIAMAILGGASPSGGKGRVGGVILGVFTIGLIRYGTGLINVSAETLKIIIGLLLIIVCAVPNLKQVLDDAKEARRRNTGLL
ncbi:MAG: ABC transporter permease [Eubacteriales bacterium]|nr:ABC transporter permease [Eubacteriales bacterium]